MKLFPRFLPFLLISVVSLSLTVSAADSPRRVLVYTKNGKGFVHDNIAAASAAIKKLGQENGFEVEVTDDPAVFTPDNLKKYKALVFNNTNNDIFDDEDQKVALQTYIQGGGGFVGLHSATGSMRKWPWFWSLIGGKFAWHAKMQPFTVVVKDNTDISTKHLPETFEWTDEFYFVDHFREGVQVLLTGDVAKLDAPAADKEKHAGKYKDFYPLAWKQTFEGGRSFYTALGHKIEHYSDPRLTQHILGGILWAMGEPPSP
jgi:type 1 glutamine amidotransferase